MNVNIRYQKKQACLSGDRMNCIMTIEKSEWEKAKAAYMRFVIDSRFSLYTNSALAKPMNAEAIYAVMRMFITNFSCSPPATVETSGPPVH